MEKYYLEKTLRINLKTFGRDNPNTAKSYIGLAHCYGSLGDVEKMEQLAERGKAICDKVFGENHLYTTFAL